MATHPKSEWLIPAALIFLSLVPIGGGALRLYWLATGVEVTPDNIRFFTSPLPVVAHILSIMVFCLLGALQFAPRLRRRWPRWHRRAGRFVLPAGLIAAVSGLWMSHFYDLPAYDGNLLYAFRLFFGTAMIVSLVLGYLAIRRRDIENHRAWMMRGFAIGIGAGTQGFFLLPWVLAFGMPDAFPRALLMGAGWVTNLIVAEWFIRKRAMPNYQAAIAP